MIGDTLSQAASEEVARPIAKSERFVFIDGLRGIAAFAVALSHLATGLVPTSPGATPRWLFYPILYGHFGVDMFFIISGFVIAWSLRHHTITPKFLARFAFRRSLRLDPPYWATMAGGIALVVLSNRMYTDRQLHVPSAGEVVAHLFYLQGVLGIENIVPPFWTLCLEIQFYLLLVVMMGVLQRLPATRSRLGEWRILLLFGTVGFASLIFWGAGRISRDPWVHHYLYVFFAGTLTLWAIEGRISKWFLGVYLSAIFVRAFTLDAPEFAFAAVAASVILLAGEMGALSTWLGSRPMQYLGKISYSLYLVHVPIGNRFLNATERLGHHGYGFRAAMVCVSFVVVMIAAHVLYVLVERPSVRFARRWRAVSLAPTVDPKGSRQEG